VNRRAASGKFILRLPPRIHAALRGEASRRGISLNAVCQQVLEEFVSGETRAGTVQGDALAVVSETRGFLGGSLAGIVLFGSVARGEQTAGSDVDLLIVLNSDRALARSLYSEWDERFTSGAYSPHFVHIPVNPMDAGSIWMETAVDGTVLYDRGGKVSGFLGGVRRLMASGKLTRRWSYGQPYWVKAEGVNAHDQ
jgi:predicted nucleotidyltransferase